MNSPTHSLDSTSLSDSNPEGQVSDKPKQVDLSFQKQPIQQNHGIFWKLMDRYRKLINKIKNTYARLDPDTRKLIQGLLQAVGLGVLAYFSVDGITNIIEKRYKSLSVLLVALEAVYLAIRLLKSSRKTKQFALLVALILIYGRFLKCNLYEKNIVEAVLSKKK